MKEDIHITNPEQLEKNSQAIAEVATRAVLNKTKRKPASLIEFEKTATKELKKSGLFTTQETTAMISRMQKTELFRKLMDEFVDDETLATKLKEGLDATKTIQIDKEPYETPDYNTRHEYIKTTLKLKGVDANAEDDPTSNFVTNINIINPYEQK